MARRGDKTQTRADTAEARFCPACGAATVSGARFCHACGAALNAADPGDGPVVGRPGGSGKKVAIGAVAGLVLVAVASGTALYLTQDESPPPQPVPSGLSILPKSIFDTPPPSSTPSTMPSGSASGTPPDLSRMAPREAADRLFNRVMMASEQGNRDEAQQFAPMALQAYGMVAELDRDAHFHLGLIHGVAGDTDGVARAIAALRQGAPEHLLALALEHDQAKRTGDQVTASRALTAFAAAYQDEVALARPEYLAHGNTIERLRSLAEAAGR